MLTPREFTLFDSYKRDIVRIRPDEVAVPGVISIYSCGPTVYSYQHIGNYRAAWLGDTITTVAKFLGWDVRWVMNITDVGHLVGDGDEGEDKIEKGARRDNKTVEEIVNHYTDDYLLQCRRLNMDLPEDELRPVASHYINQQMIIALQLVLMGRAYFLDDGIYFDSKANNDLQLPFSLQQEGDSAFTGREIKNRQKSPADFALWKFVDPQSLQKWYFGAFPEALSILNEIDSDLKPDGIISRPGCPGWHSECVAMIGTLFGFDEHNVNGIPTFSFDRLRGRKTTIDIHTGGEDHIDVHHKNEILQSEALGFHLSTYWVHNKFVLVDGKKMAKADGNTYHLNDIIAKGYDPLAYRLMLMEHLYSEQLNFTWDKLDQSNNRLLGLRKDVAQIRSMAQSHPDYTYSKDVPAKQLEVYQDVLADNLNIPLFLEKMQKLIGEVLDMVVSEKRFKTDNINLIRKLDNEVARLNLWPDIPQSLMDLAKRRVLAKSQKSYDQADRLREEIMSQGWNIGDYPWGYGLWKVR